MTQFARFVIVGLVTASLDYLTLYLLVDYSCANYLAASGIGFCLGSALNYVLSIGWVFGRGRFGLPIEIAMFMATSAAGLLINQAVMWLFTGRLGIHYLIAKAVSLTAVTAWNFLSKKTLVFAN